MGNRLTAVEFGRKLRALRIAAGYTEAKDFAVRIGKSPEQLSRWENGKAQPGLDTLVKLAAILGVGVTELTESAEQPDVPPSYNEAREEEELARIGGLPDPLLRTMERESIAAVIRAQGMRDACRAARVEAEKAPSRNLPEGISSDLLAEAKRALKTWQTWQRRREGRGEGPPNGKQGPSDQPPPDE